MSGPCGALTVHIIDGVQLPVVNKFGETQLQRVPETPAVTALKDLIMSAITVITALRF